MLGIIVAFANGHPFWGAALVLLVPVFIFLLAGLFVVNPNQGRVLQLFGRYIGTVKEPGLRWANPLLTKRKVSLRVRNFETERSKVNDTESNPIEMASVVVWKVVDTPEAMFEVDDYVNYVQCAERVGAQKPGDPLPV